MAVDLTVDRYDDRGAAAWLVERHVRHERGGARVKASWRGVTEDTSTFCEMERVNSGGDEEGGAGVVM